MDSFIFNSFKNKLLTGGLKRTDTWNFHIVGKDLTETLGEDIMPKLENITEINDIIRKNEPEKNIESFYCNYRPIYYTYKPNRDTASSDKPIYVDNNNWAEFIEKFPNNSHLENLFLERGGEFYREYITETTNEVDNDTTTIKETKVRGFYFVMTAEELRWCADKVNGKIDGNDINLYNNYINIVLGDNIGTDNNKLSNNKRIDFCIGESASRPYEGIFFGNGYIIKNLTLVCYNNNNGIIGNLGTEGRIVSLRIDGNNVVQCRKQLNITHLINECTDINAGFVCGKNNGSICDIEFSGKVFFKGFIPGVYSVANRTDDGNAFAHPGQNCFYPTYMCINSMANIIPYIGYFNEGVFSTNSYGEGTTGKGYWKCDNLYTDELHTPYIGTAYQGEWAYHSSAIKYDDESYYTTSGITAHALYYDLDGMNETLDYVTREKDWYNLSLMKVTTAALPEGYSGWSANYELTAARYMDKPIKLHQFNRVSYNTGLLIGCNNGSVSAVNMSAKSVFGGTYVGFHGGIAGKQIANNKIISDICVNLHTTDDDTRDYYISDTGDTGKLIASDKPICIMTTNKLYVSDEKKRFFNYGKKDNGIDWGQLPAIRLGIGSFINEKSLVSLKEIFTYTINEKIWDNQLWRQKSPREVASDCGITVTDKEIFNVSADIYSELEVISNIPTSSIDIDTQGGLCYRYGHLPYTSNGLARNDYINIDDVKKNKDNEFSIFNSKMIEEGSDDKGKYWIIKNLRFSVNALYFDERVITRNNAVDANGLANISLKWDDIILQQTGRMLSQYYTFITGGEIAELKLRKYEASQSRYIPNTVSDGAMTAYERRYEYESFYIESAKGIILYIMHSGDSGAGSDNMKKRTVSMYELYLNNSRTPQDIFNENEILPITYTDSNGVSHTGSTFFDNNASNGKFLACHGDVYSMPLITKLKSTVGIDGTKNFCIKKRSIKNVGAMFGSLVLSTYQRMQNISAYLYNENPIKFKHYINVDCYEGEFLGKEGAEWFDTDAAIQGHGYFKKDNPDHKKIGYYEITGTSSGNAGYSNTLDVGSKEAFPIFPGSLVGTYNGKLMYAYPITTNPELDDYAMDNRFAAFAAVCEWDSSNISDKSIKEQTGINKRYIDFKNVKLAYDEKNDLTTNANYRYMSPMYLSRTELRGGTEPTYNFGIALPFIAEIKPNFIAIPSILQCPMSNIKEYGSKDPEVIYGRIGMFTQDQVLASPSNNPNFWSINLNVDLPGVKNTIDRRRLETESILDDGWFNVNFSGENFLGNMFSTEEITIHQNTFGDLAFGKKNGSYVGSQGFGRHNLLYTECASTKSLSLGMDKWNPTEDYIGFIENKISMPEVYFGSSKVLRRYDHTYFLPEDNELIIGNGITCGEFMSMYFPIYGNKAKIDTLSIPFSASFKDKSFCFLESEALQENRLSADYAEELGVNIFKYYYTTARGNILNSFSYDVTIENNETENGMQYGYYISDDITGFNYGYKDTSDRDINEVLPIYNDDFYYSGNIVHLGTMCSEECIMNIISHVNEYTTSGISANDFDGLLVTDKDDNTVMYINVGLGNCDGKQSWSMPCTYTNNKNSKGLLLEIK